MGGSVLSSAPARPLTPPAVDQRERLLPPVAVLRDTMKSVVISRGAAVVQDSEARKDPVLLVQALLDLRDKFLRVVDEAFDGDKDFHRALKEVRAPLLRLTHAVSTPHTPHSAGV